MPSTTTKTLDDLASEVRFILNDVELPYRYTDEQLMTVFNTCLREAYRLRPDLYIGQFIDGVLSNNQVMTYTVADLQVADGVANPTPPNPPTPFPLDDRLAYGPCVYFCTGRLEIEDDEFADNNRAMLLLQAFRQQLIGMGG